jgi:hypothetical protein
LNGQPKAMTHGAQRRRLRGIAKFRFSLKQQITTPGKTELRRAFIAFQYLAGRLNSASFGVYTAMTK